MLKLARKEGQSIYLILANGERIRVEIAERSGASTKVVVDAPATITIVREELLPTVTSRNRDIQFGR